MTPLVLCIVMAVGCALVIARAARTPPSRTRRAYLVWVIPLFTGLGLIICSVGYDNVRPSSWPALSFVARVGAIAWWLGVLLISAHLVVGWFGWPKMLIPQAFRDQPTWLSESRLAREERRERERSGLPPTDHPVEIREVNLDEGTDNAKRFHAAICGECQWMALAESIDPVAELRSEAAKHTTNVAREVVVEHL